MSCILDEAVVKLPGIGPVSAQALAARGITTFLDLLDLIPVEYEDYRTLTPISALQADVPALVEAIVKSMQSWFYGGKRLLRVTLIENAASAHKNVPTLELLWFRPARGMNKRLQRGSVVRVFGNPAATEKGLRMTHPRLLAPDSPPRICARYPKIEGVAGAALQKALKACVSRCAADVQDAIPSLLLKKENLMSLADAYRALHEPDVTLSDEDLRALNEGRSPAHERLRLEHWFTFELERINGGRQNSRAQAFVATQDALLTGRRALEFTLTKAQERVVSDISSALGSHQAMRRLLQGEVGSGKTAVVWLLANQVSQAHAQSVLLAPTEVLAEQHFVTIDRWSRRVGMRSALLTASIPSAERKEIIMRLKRGEIDLVIGTHALFSDDIEFARLGFVIVDEQHRFGVAQRLRLLDRKHAFEPHLLVMTATPIPRSLAWIVYAGMDMSVLDELPAGRQPIVTSMLPHKKYSLMRKNIVNALRAGGRAFVVCPAIDTQEDMLSVERVSQVIERDFGAERVAILHGRLDAKERELRFEQFRSGQRPILICTTLIEVGVDVPEANLMVIMQSERYGLAQLHQLRGRVGRGNLASECLLMHGELNEQAHARLQTLCELSDGFRIAERDLELRGPGEILGLRQSGLRWQVGIALEAELALWQRAKALAQEWRALRPTLQSGVPNPESVARRSAQRARARAGMGFS